VDSRFTIYPSPSSGIPIIRNEELILLRAEANLQLGNLNTALGDLNFVRVNSGGLDSITTASWNGMSPNQRIDALLYERRYSLLFEGGHRWIDNRRYGRLATLPKALPQDVVYPRFLLPDDECVARSPTPAGCSVPRPF
jgi:hypothetical protein